MYDIDKIWETIIAVLFAVFGGLARILNVKSNKKLKWGKILSELFISGFSGIMVLMLARVYGLSGDWVGVICGMSGWIGPKILDIIAELISKKAGIEINDKHDKNIDDKQ